MKLSNKILIGAFAAGLLLTLAIMVQLRITQKNYLSTLTTGNKDWVVAEFLIQPFETLHVGNHFEVKWHRGAPMVKVRIEENIKPFLKVSQDSGVLHIDLDQMKLFRTHGGIVVDVWSEHLYKIQLEDFVQFEAMDTLNGEVIHIDVQDHAQLTLGLQAAEARIRLYDFCQVDLSGRAESAILHMGDHSQLEGRRLQLTAAEVEMSDFSNADLSVSGMLKANCVDHAQLSYRGDSVHAEVSQRDFAEIRKEK
ncbi:MAG TPA: DUF2807 domain-containing protein [Saprospiraceae bacterium]|nr:DUF2807 domain-containing protein [Saprospiraceae bacterium]